MIVVEIKRQFNIHWKGFIKISTYPMQISATDHWKKSLILVKI